MSLTEELEQAAGRAAQAAGPSVVRIGRGRGRGAGVVVGDGVVLTNAHNLRGTETTVTFADGRVVTASVTAADVDGDLAVLAVDTAGAPVIAWAPDSELRLGTPVSRTRPAKGCASGSARCRLSAGRSVGRAADA